MSDLLHPSPQDLEDFMLGRLSQRESRRVILHLLPGCLRCREVTSAYWRLGAPEEAGVSGRFSYDEAVERVFGSILGARASLEAERAAARQRIAELEAWPLMRWPSLVLSDPAYHTWGFCEALLERSEICWNLRNPRDVRDSELCAGLAVAVSERIGKGTHPAAFLEELRARAWITLADARRRSGDLATAEEALRAAEAHLLRGSGDRLEKARLLERKAGLRIAQERFGEAARLLSRAILLYRRAGQWDRVGRVLIDLGCVRAASGDLEGAVPALRQGFALTPPEERGWTSWMWLLLDRFRGVTARLRR